MPHSVESIAVKYLNFAFADVTKLVRYKQFNSLLENRDKRLEKLLQGK
jgi:hypothetical protein